MNLYLQFKWAMVQLQANQHLLLQPWILAERIGSIVLSGNLFDTMTREKASEKVTLRVIEKKISEQSIACYLRGGIINSIASKISFSDSIASETQR